jgi:hypothetical protein
VRISTALFVHDLPPSDDESAHTSAQTHTLQILNCVYGRDDSTTAEAVTVHMADLDLDARRLLHTAVARRRLSFDKVRPCAELANAFTCHKVVGQRETAWLDPSDQSAPKMHCAELVSLVSHILPEIVDVHKSQRPDELAAWNNIYNLLSCQVTGSISSKEPRPSMLSVHIAPRG